MSAIIFWRAEASRLRGSVWLAFAVALLALAGAMVAPLQARADTPIVIADPAGNTIWGTGWSPGDVTLTQAHAADELSNWSYTNTVVADGAGNLTYTPAQYYLNPGQTITMSQGSTVKTLVVSLLRTSGAYDPDDYVWGTAWPDTTVTVGAQGSLSSVTTTVDADGYWETKLSPSFDILASSEGTATQTDADGDVTIARWRVEQPTISLLIDEELLVGDGWRPGSTVTFGIPPWWKDGRAVVGSDGTFEAQPMFAFNYYHNVMRASDGFITKQVVLANLKLTGISTEGNWLRGTGDPGNGVGVIVADTNPIVQREAEIDSWGNWIVSLAPYDLRPGAQGTLYQIDVDGDTTDLDWAAPQSAVTRLSKPSVSPTTPRRRRTATITSKLSPAAAVYAGTSKLYLSHWESKIVRKRVNGRIKRVKVWYWRLRSTVTMSRNSSGKLTAKVKLYQSGKWRAYVKFSPKTDAFRASTSSVRTFRVK